MLSSAETLGLILTSGGLILAFFLKRLVESIDKIGDTLNEIKTSLARNEEKHLALEKRVENLEDKK